MGFLHVIAGPDHLSALATLSSNLGNCKAFQLGVRWGIGHSAGLVLVATIILVSTNSGGEIAISETVTIVLQSIVGVFMICLGIYSLHGAVRRDKYRQNQLNNYALRSTDLLTTSTRHPQKEHMDLDFSYDDKDGMDNPHFSLQDGEASLSMADVNFHHQQASNRGLTSLEKKAQNSKKLHLFQIDDDAADDDIENEKDSPMIDIKDQHHNAENDDDDNIIVDSQITSSNRSKLAAFAIGIVHGIAGPGGVLGILPAIELHNYGLAYTYLGSFCVTSILVMGTFSAAYGVCTKEISQRVRIEFQLDCFSASLSLLVGIIWLCLLYTGKLGKVIG
eukprot:CAMPEP_0172421884 /NCGR_PEP_ID=MMETSP1064-20121228/8122_1 /TAXON_ID=202472 /ORGANISM="Aulacoseira subarctica , Strain CCAP 1002/5" /LENGTH=333 /DNA_ID=CAMNT_0013162511 /DNA_START=140 /DNA_END=1141 /DNA_ORIENTATION=+